MRYKGIEIQTHLGGSTEATAEAPEGKQFKSTGTTEVVCGLSGGGKVCLKLCVDSVKRDIDGGFEAYSGESEEE